jgi:beta-mannosidase
MPAQLTPDKEAPTQGKAEGSLSSSRRFLAGGALDLCGNWAISFSDEARPPNPALGIPCQVPGGIHAALIDAGLLGDISEERGFIEAMQWEGKHKWLQRTFDWNPPEQKDPVWLVFQGVDPQCEVFLNGRSIAMYRGMFGGPHVEVTDFLREGSNDLLVHLPPEDLATEATRQSLLAGCPKQIDHPRGDKYLKPSQMLGGNDFPRLVSAGIWQPVRLETRPAGAVADAWMQTTRTEDAGVALLVEGHLHGPSGGETVGIRLRDPDGGLCWEGSATTDLSGRFQVTTALESAQLWWPNGSGDQPLYELEASARTGLPLRRKAGIRTIEWGRNPGTDVDLTLVVNGLPVFARGGNWPTLDKTLDFRHAAERYHRALLLAKEANVNVMRFWGGYARELDVFYDLCDRMGILVLHDFPVANSVQADDVDREVYSRQVRTLIRQLRPRACIAAWMGGNELRQCEVVGSAMDDLTALGGEIAGEEDPGRRYFASSYLLRAGLTDEYEHYGRRSSALDALAGALVAEPKFSVEFNSGSHSAFVCSEGLAEKLLPSTGKAWPPTPDVHIRKINTSPWSQEFMEGSLPARGTSAGAAPYGSWDELCYYSDLFNGFAVRAQIGNWRSRLFHCAGSLVWCWTDQQAMFGWGAVDYFGAPRALYYFLKRAFAPVAVNFRYLAPELDFRERIRSGVWVVNESGRTLRGYSVRITIHGSDLRPIMELGPEREGTVLRSGAKIKLSTSTRPIPTGSSLESIDLNGIGYLFPLFEQCGLTPCDLDFEQKPDRRFFGLTTSLLDADNRLISREFYPFNFAWHDSEEVCALPQARLSVTREDNAIRVTNTSDVPALWVRFSAEDVPPEFCHFDENWVTLLPGETMTLQIRTRHAPLPPSLHVRWRGVNCTGRK